MERTEIMCPSESNTQSNLSIFEGMVGFEDFNPMDDCSISVIFDDLQEGTLLSILNDELFDDLLANPTEITITQPFRERKEQTKQDNVGLCNFSLESDEENKSNTASGEVQYYDESIRLSGEKHSLHVYKHADSATVCAGTPDLRVATRKRVICDEYETSISTKEQKLSPMIDLQHLLECVQHDHCYTRAESEMKTKNDADRRGSFTSEKSTHSTASDSLEEGSNSDGGYDTMSVTTSPGTRSHTEGPRVLPPKSSPPSPKITVPPLTPLGECIDPVALIDARIKHFMCSREVNLTEEEKETLKAEGFPIPTTLPLTKAEEKALRNVRRKIRNKVAAQESRKRKKEHLLTLEESLLLTQLKKFQDISSTGGARRSTQVGACLMVVALCFAVIIGGFAPKERWNSLQQSDYAISSVRSRSLLSLEQQTNFQSMACDWFRYIFVTEREESSINCFSNNNNLDADDANICKRKDYLPASFNEVLINVSGYGRECS